MDEIHAVDSRKVGPQGQPMFEFSKAFECPRDPVMLKWMHWFKSKGIYSEIRLSHKKRYISYTLWREGIEADTTPSTTGVRVRAKAHMRREQ
jgi:hypothetical protein